MGAIHHELLIMRIIMFVLAAIALVIESSGATPELPETETILFEGVHQESPEQLVPEGEMLLETEDPSLKKIDRLLLRKALFMNVGKVKQKTKKVAKTKGLTPQEKNAGKEVTKVASGVDTLVRDLKAKKKENKRLRELLYKRDHQKKELATKRAAKQAKELAAKRNKKAAAAKEVASKEAAKKSAAKESRQKAAKKAAAQEATAKAAAKQKEAAAKAAAKQQEARQKVAAKEANQKAAAKEGATKAAAKKEKTTKEFSAKEAAKKEHKKKSGKEIVEKRIGEKAAKAAKGAAKSAAERAGKRAAA